MFSAEKKTGNVMLDLVREKKIKRGDTTIIKIKQQKINCISAIWHLRGHLLGSLGRNFGGLLHPYQHNYRICRTHTVLDEKSFISFT